MREIEDILINGDKDEVYDLACDTERCVGVDWREDEIDMLGYFAKHLPAGSLSYSIDDGDDDLMHLTYAGVRHEVRLSRSMRDRYIVIRALANVIRPGYQFRVFRLSLQGDTHSFLVRPAAWWKEMEEAFPARINEVFAPLSEEMDFA